jgi:galactokinase
MFEKYFRHILPAEISGEQFLAEHGAIPDRLTEVEPGGKYSPRSAAAYHIGESLRAREFSGHLGALANLAPAERRARAEAAGRILLESHAASGAEAGLRMAEADRVVELVKSRGAAKGFYGARGVGTGGSVTVFADNTPAVRDELQKIAEEHRQKTGLVPQLLAGSGAGAAEAAPQRIAVKDLAGG